MPTVTPLLNYLPAGPGPRVPALKVNCIPHSVIQSWGVTPTHSLLLIKKARLKLDKKLADFCDGYIDILHLCRLGRAMRDVGRL
jgi:hypothetical protein